VWYGKEPSLLKAMSAYHRSKFTGNGDCRQIPEKFAQAAKIRFTILRPAQEFSPLPAKGC
jgi:hypothetical protein